MMNRKWIYGLLLALIVWAAAAGLIVREIFQNQELRVIFLDVGQGDAILIEEGSYQVLIDGGRNGQILLEKLGGYIPFWDRKIEMVVATHPDQDHIGGLIEVLEKYKVGAVIRTKDQADSQTFKVFDEFAAKSIPVEAVSQTQINFPGGSVFKILYPFGSVANENLESSNDFSVISKLQWKDYSFLLMGDLSLEKEKELVGKNIDLRADVLKAAHHGSKYSTGDDFLEKVNPKQAIISVGKNNMYSHPSPEVVEKLKNRGIEILRTDERGDIVYRCKIDRCFIN